MSEETKEIEGVDFIIAKGDNDTKPRKYSDGEEILKEGKEYRASAKKFFENRQELRNIAKDFPIYTNIDLSNTNLRFAHLSSAHLIEVNLNGADLSFAHLSDVNLVDANLSGANLSSADLSGADLSGADLSDANLSGVNLVGARLIAADLSGANLSKTYLENTKFHAAKFNNTNLINATLNDTTFSEEQKENAFFTQKEKELKELKEENKQQKQTIEEIGEEQTNKLLSGFQTLKDDFGKEEKNWLWGVGVSFGVLLITIICIIFYQLNPSFFKEVLSFINFLNIQDLYITFLPLIILCSTLLYFSVHQYSKAKNLRIENQNKIALIYGYQAFQAKTDEDKDKKYEYFLQNFSDVIFTKAIPSKNENNLPIDEIVKLKSLFKD